jgi:aspartyl-tRNA(Asn)/glutamyl-tRNA(Gln) amidotransferase subunit C
MTTSRRYSKKFSNMPREGGYGIRPYRIMLTNNQTKCGDIMITYDELIKLAALAKLSMDGEDMDALARDISNILEFADSIAQAAVDLPEGDTDEADWVFRDDNLQPSLPANDILSNAGEQQDGYFVARKRGGLS